MPDKTCSVVLVIVFKYVSDIKIKASRNKNAGVMRMRAGTQNTIIGVPLLHIPVYGGNARGFVKIDN